ncbi:CheR family methyltransferase [Caldimonas tepidiphila]|uniref:CheR family methyltransferase n=1 Tax=Caldimonas tepidiphila TaxID=2315841 RepID=UPI000E5B9210|nr:CheR family methyltransferase [Caldimonas tepidiphila]
MTQDPALPDTGALTPSSLDFPVVGLGASAGGLPALLRFFKQMPGDSGMAFVVILHLSPSHASEAHAVLQRVTNMKTVQVHEPCVIERDHIYVIPPSRHLSLNDSYLRVTEMDRPRHRHIAVDLFFRALAQVHRERAFGIVLSGTGSDGAVGIARVKELGGVTFAQDPGDAEFEGMPRAAVATGVIDWVLPVDEMPRKLLEIRANARLIELPPLADEEESAALASARPASQEAETALREIMALLRLRTGHDFRHYKRATLLRRLERRLQVHALPSLPAYRALLQEQPAEAQALLKDLLIGVTNFFRDPEAFDALGREAAPRLFGPQRGAEPVRAWVAGCSSGEEAYSVAMLLLEQAGATRGTPEIQVFATDIDEAAIAAARTGLYPESIAADVAPVRLRQFFAKDGNHYRIRKEVRERILFASHNLLRDPPFSKLDLVCCRNLLIYLDREVQPQILEMFHFALRPGGLLFLGSSESADAVPQLFSVVDKKNRIYRANAVAQATRYHSTVPLEVFDGHVAGPREPVAERRRVSYAELHQRLAEQHAPPSVLVDAEAHIVHLSEQAGRFLRHTGGAPSHHLPALVRPELRLELRTALFQALQSGRSVEARRVRLESEERISYVNMTVRPVQEPTLDATLALVLFDEVEETMGAAPPSGGPGEARDPLVLQLEAELKRVKQQLQDTIEQYETSTEELKASNEELQAINEELRSTTEELETSKEELQSINEELITVNHELKSKVEETGKVNDDLQNLIASTDIATVFVDRAMSIKRYTPRATEIFSLIPGDIGRSLLDIRHRLDYELLAEDAAEAFQSLRLIEREVTGADGRWYLARMLPYRTTEDRIDGAVLTFVDITGRRSAEQRLRRGEALLRLVAESTKDYAILTLDLDGRITTWNRGAERLFGYTEAEALGQHSALLFPPEDRENGAVEEELRRAREDGRAEDERWHQRRDGRRVFCSGVTTPLFFDGGLQGYAKIARDVTGTKRMESEREAQLAQEAARRAEAQAASELKDEFLAVLSHELKNPLNLIQMNAELLMRLPAARAVQAVTAAAETIRATVHSQAQIIDDLLDLSRLNTGKLALRPAAVELGATVRRIVDAMAQDAARKSIGLHLEAQAEPIMLRADPVRVEQIVWNLLSNAFKFTPRGGGVTVRIGTEDGFGRIEVSDTGRGIDPAFLPRLFDMFQQAQERSTRREGGLGIGLALVRQLAELHGGRIEAASEGPGKGACFMVRLPLQAGQDAAREPLSEAEERPFEGLRMMVVDDEPQAAQVLRQLLELEGVDVTVASSAQQALEACARVGFDVVLCDIAMPGADAHAFVQALRALPRHGATRLVAVTGFDRPVDRLHAQDAGFDAQLGKPLTLERLLRVLGELKVARTDGPG